MRRKKRPENTARAQSILEWDDRLSEQTEAEHAMLSSENGILVNAMMSDCESDASLSYFEGD